MRGCVWLAVSVSNAGLRGWVPNFVPRGGSTGSTTSWSQGRLPDPAYARCSVARDEQKDDDESCDVAMTGAEVETSIPDTQADEARGFVVTTMLVVRISQRRNLQCDECDGFPKG